MNETWSAQSTPRDLFPITNPIVPPTFASSSTSSDPLRPSAGSTRLDSALPLIEMSRVPKEGFLFSLLFSLLSFLISWVSPSPRSADCALSLPVGRKRIFVIVSLPSSLVPRPLPSSLFPPCESLFPPHSYVFPFWTARDELDGDDPPPTIQPAEHVR